MDLEFSNKIDRYGRKPILWIYQKGQLQKFAGKDIEGVATIIDEKQGIVEVRSGKELFSKHKLKLGAGAIPCILVSSEHGRLWPEKTLEEACERFKEQFGIGKGLSFAAFAADLQRDFPLTHVRLTTGENAPRSGSFG